MDQKICERSRIRSGACRRSSRTSQKVLDDAQVKDKPTVQSVLPHFDRRFKGNSEDMSTLASTPAGERRPLSAPTSRPCSILRLIAAGSGCGNPIDIGQGNRNDVANLKK